MYQPAIPIPRTPAFHAALAALCIFISACARPPEPAAGAPSPETVSAAPLPAPAVEEPTTVEPVAEVDPDAERPPTRAESWTGPGPAPVPGAILPDRRIVAYYGNPLSKRMGILGEVPPDEMLRRLDREVAAWNAADPAVPAVPALHLVAVVAHADPGWDGKYRGRVSEEVVERVAEWAERRDALVFLDIQPALSSVQEELPRLEKYLVRPNVHLGLDPEFSMKQGHKPGTRIGTMDAADINFAVDFLAELVQRHGLPPKVLVVHRFTRAMITSEEDIKLRPEVQVVIHMDGWGPPALKRRSYNTFVGSDPVQFTGFKLFYHNDTKAGDPLMTPAQIVELDPPPVYVQYH
jgi:hypothetical protein